MDERLYITVEYDCKLCGISNRKVTVLARTPIQDIINWMEYEVATKVGRDHFTLHPWCLNKVNKIAGDIKIPVLSDKGIGFPRAH